MTDEPIRKQYDHGVWWSTESEKDFIDHIGTFSKEKDDRREEKGHRRMRLLLNYRASIFIRKHWGNIDFLEILKYVDMVIKKEGEVIFIEKSEEEKDGTL